MTDYLTQAVLATWAARNLPARLNVSATAKLLGFTESDIQILMAVGMLTPLGDLEGIGRLRLPTAVSG
jgi:hypothetical protein